MSGDSYWPIDTNEINKSIDTYIKLKKTKFETASYRMKRQTNLILAVNLKSRNYSSRKMPKVISKIVNLSYAETDLLIPNKFLSNFPEHYKNKILIAIKKYIVKLVCYIFRTEKVKRLRLRLTRILNYDA